jgi:hypothetical protein
VKNNSRPVGLGLAALGAALVIAAPAAAIGGAGVPRLVSLSAATHKVSAHTCQATRKNEKRSKFIPIACEQPPKMNMFSAAALAKATALATLGG